MSERVGSLGPETMLTWGRGLTRLMPLPKTPGRERSTRLRNPGAAGNRSFRATWYTPDGWISQIEAAEKATARGAPIAGFTYPQGAILAAQYLPIGGDPISSPVRSDCSLLRGGKITQLGPELAIAGVGLQGDFAAVSRFMR